MSLILDALKRAERERRELMPAFADADPSALSTPARRRNRLRIGAVVLLLAAAMAIGWFLLGRRPTPVAAPAAAVASKPASVVPVPPALATPSPSQNSIATSTVIPGTEGMVSLEELAPAAATLPPAIEMAPVSIPAAKPMPAAPTASAAPAADSEPEAETETDASAGPEAPATAAAAGPPAALTQAVPLRRFREMTPEFRADFPALTIEVHVYDRLVSRRWVMVNGKRYKEGERLVEGPAVVEIVSDGIVLDFRGQQVLYTLRR